MGDLLGVIVFLAIACSFTAAAKKESGKGGGFGAGTKGAGGFNTMRNTIRSEMRKTQMPDAGNVDNEAKEASKFDNMQAKKRKAMSEKSKINEKTHSHEGEVIGSLSALEDRNNDWLARQIREENRKKTLL